MINDETKGITVKKIVRPHTPSQYQPSVTTYTPGYRPGYRPGYIRTTARPNVVVVKEESFHYHFNENGTVDVEIPTQADETEFQLKVRINVLIMNNSMKFRNFFRIIFLVLSIRICHGVSLPLKLAKKYHFTGNLYARGDKFGPILSSYK